jgi:hypothetical protein
VVRVLQPKKLYEMMKALGAKPLSRLIRGDPVAKELGVQFNSWAKKLFRMIGELVESDDPVRTIEHSNERS